jgi:hypothetical protein
MCVAQLHAINIALPIVMCVAQPYVIHVLLDIPPGLELILDNVSGLLVRVITTCTIPQQQNPPRVLSGIVTSGIVTNGIVTNGIVTNGSVMHTCSITNVWMGTLQTRIWQIMQIPKISGFTRLGLPTVYPHKECWT